MVLWEITLTTAYFLGLKRTYRLALRIQRRVVSPKHPKVRAFLQRKIRSVFDIALTVHRNIQERDIEVGKNLGNRLLRWLDKMKPSANIRGPPESRPPGGTGPNVNMTKQVTNSSYLKTPGNIQSSRNQESDRHLFSLSRPRWSRPFPTIPTMMRSPRLTGTTSQHRHFTSNPELFRSSRQASGPRRFEGVIRQDIMQFLLRN